MMKALVLVLASAVVFGCYSNTPIKPTELPKLNGSTVVGLGQQGNTAVYGVTVAHVEAPDGHLEEVAGSFDLVVTDRRRGEVDFDHPVHSEIEGDSLSIQGGNRARTVFNLHDVTQADVVQPNNTGTLLWCTLPFIPAMALAIVLIEATR